MKNSQLDRVMKLVRRTGDRFVILDKETDEVVAMMNLDEYERLLDGSDSLGELDDEEMMRKINRDIAAWRARQNYAEEETADEAVSPWEEDDENDDKAPDLSPEDDDELDEIFPEKAEEPRYVVKNTAEEPVATHAEEVSLGDIPHDDEEEEKFYLEPVE